MAIQRYLNFDSLSTSNNAVQGYLQIHWRQVQNAYYILHTVNRILQNITNGEQFTIFCKIRFTVCSTVCSMQYVVCILYLSDTKPNPNPSLDLQYAVCSMHFVLAQYTGDEVYSTDLILLESTKMTTAKKWCK